MPDANRPSKPAAQSPAAESTFRPAQLPPRVVKKKKPVRREAAAAAERENGPAAAPSELLVPIILIVVGLIGTTTTTIVFRDEEYPFVVWVVTRMILIVFSAVITYGALFIAAQVLDTDYGYISTGVLKVAAIALTQDWVGDVVHGVPILSWVVSAATTYGMFMYFFDLDLGDAIASVVIVGVVHVLVAMLLFAAIIGAMHSGHAVHLPIPAPAVDADEGPDEDEPLDPNALGPGAIPGR